MNVAVFGSANPLPGEELYQQAYRLGELLGAAGHTVLTGGYGGTMEAVSRGAAEAGSHVIGVTCSEIENFKRVSPNRWVKEIRHYHTLNERLAGLMEDCQAAVGLPGGPGTLTEITLLWNRLIIKSIPPLPLILVGSAWQLVFREFLMAQAGCVAAADGDLLTFAETVEQAAALLSIHGA